MVVYSVNCGHYPAFKDASAARKKLLKGAGSIFVVGDCYTVKILTTLKKAEAEGFRDRLPDGLDVWIEERNTSVL